MAQQIIYLPNAIDVGVTDNTLQNVALGILGDTVTQTITVNTIDDTTGEITSTATYSTINPYCQNMVASIQWSLFLTFTLLIFGLIRSLFNAFSRGGD